MKKLLLLLALTILTACANNTQNESFGIVSLSPSITETLLHLGLSDYIIGIDIHSERFGFSEDIPRFNMFSLDTEYLTMLNPEIIFAAFPTDEILDITIIPPANSLSEIEDQIKLIGSLTEREEEADLLIDNMNTRIYNMINFLNESFGENPITAYFEISTDPSIFTTGNGTFLNNILETLGVTNIFQDVPGWIPVVEEEVISRNPQIIFTNVAELEDPVAEIINRSGWEVITAVREGNVFYIDSHASSSSNHNIALAVEQIAAALIQAR